VKRSLAVFQVTVTGLGRVLAEINADRNTDTAVPVNQPDVVSPAADVLDRQSRDRSIAQAAYFARAAQAQFAASVTAPLPEYRACFG
jgi:hypothetical protein